MYINDYQVMLVHTSRPLQRDRCTVKDVMRETIGMSNVLWVDLCSRIKKKILPNHTDNTDIGD